jgi:RHS repeat-associated protein
MTQFSFSVNGQSITGTLAYNPNGTIASRVINDPFQASTNETCTYRYDAWARMSRANCTNFNSAYEFDRYGNMTKTGTTSFTPTYSATTNRMTAIGAVTPTYDANGNILTDGTSTYTWDAEGRMLTGPGVDGIIYNGFGQMAEQTRGSAHQQLVYFPSGELLALMNGQSLNFAYVPLPSGGPAVYDSNGLLYYTHPDNTKSVRVTTTPAKTLFSNLSYTPFGEKYNDTIAPGVISSVLYFAGHNQTTVAGLYDTPTRKYNPLQGRWISADMNNAANPGDPQTFNLYSYVTNRPFDMTDSMGASDDLVFPELGTGAPAQDPSSYDPYGYLNPDSEPALTYNAGEPAGGAGGSYSTASIILEQLGKIDPIGLSAGELEAVPEYLSYAAKLARGAFIGPIESDALMHARLLREMQYYTGNGAKSLRSVQTVTDSVLDSYGSLFKGPSLALGLTNPGMTRSEVIEAVQAAGGRFKYRSGLSRFAESIGAKTYEQFTANRSLMLQEGIVERMNAILDEGGTIHFNLDGLEDIPGSVAGTSRQGTLVEVLGEKTIFGNPKMIRVPFSSGHTIFELRYLKGEWKRFEPITFFYRNGQMIIDAAPGGQSYVPW